MDKPTYPIDLIAIRDAKQKIARSVIKSWNVNYIMAQPEVQPQADPTSYYEENTLVEEPIQETHEEQPELTPEQEEAIRNANEIFARLEAEKAADEAVKAAEIAAAMEARDAADAAARGDEPADSDFNATTGSYSGAYGKGDISDDTKDQAASILAEKSDAMADLINQIQNG